MSTWAQFQALRDQQNEEPDLLVRSRKDACVEVMRTEDLGALGRVSRQGKADGEAVVDMFHIKGIHWRSVGEKFLLRSLRYQGVSERQRRDWENCADPLLPWQLTWEAWTDWLKAQDMAPFVPVLTIQSGSQMGVGSKSYKFQIGWEKLRNWALERRNERRALKCWVAIWKLIQDPFAQGWKYV